MLKLDLTIGEMLEILETEAVGVPARTLKRKVNLCMGQGRCLLAD